VSDSEQRQLSFRNHPTTEESLLILPDLMHVHMIGAVVDALLYRIDVAFRIRELAREHDVPIIENPPLARALFASVDVDEAIPTEHFKAVAQIIGFVMRMHDKRAWRA